jgi:hypothetical protein
MSRFLPLLALLALLAAPAIRAAAEPRPAGGETLKERLSDKASDEQRVDDCKVPPERRGDSTRPTECPPRRVPETQPAPGSSMGTGSL